MKTTNDLIDDLIEKPIDLPSTGTYEPTVVITGGGTGNLSARHLANSLSGHKDVFVELLSVDTNLSQNHLGKVPPLSSTQFAALDPNATIQALNRADAGETGDQFLLETAPSTEPDGKPYHSRITAKLEDGAGAGQDPRAGKLSFLSNISDGSNIKVELERIQKRLIGLKQTIKKRAKGLKMAPRVRVFIVLSLSGGTGRGVVESLPVLCREIFGKAGCSITLITALPGEHLDQVLSAPTIERLQTRANTIGGVREIQTYLTEDHSTREFVFSKSLSLKLGTNSFVNSVWLLGEETLDHVPLDSYDDVSYAIGQFLYGFLASGAGTSFNAGLVNFFDGSIGDDDGWGPKAYNSFGVASVEMPVDDLSNYGLRRGVDENIHHWKRLTTTEVDVSADAKDLLSRIGLGDFDVLCERIAPSVPEADYLEDEKNLKHQLQIKRQEFLNEADLRIKKLPQALENRSGEMVEQVEKVNSEASSILSNTVPSLAAQGADHARRVLRQVKQKIETHLEENRNRVSERAGDKDSLLRSIGKKEKWINSVFIPFDRRIRRRFVGDVQALLYLAVNESVSGQVVKCLTNVAQQIDDYLQEITTFENEITALEVQNREEIGALTGKKPPSSLVTFALSHSRFEDWYKDNPIPVTEKIRMSALSRESFVKGALEPVMKPFIAQVRNLKVLDMAKSDPEVMNKLLALDIASKPLFGMGRAAPAMEDLLPQKFLVGNFENHESIHEQFEAVADRHPTVLDSPNPYVVSAIQTISNFGIGRWRRFPEAMAAYEQDPWRAHVVSDFDKFPPLVRRAKDEENSLLTLGLGLLTDSISQRGSRYYINVEEDKGNNPSFRFSGYRKLEEYPEADKCPAAVLLVNHNLVSVPAKGRKAELLLGDSLPSTLVELSSPKVNGLAGHVELLNEELEAQIGGVAYKKLVRDFIDSVLEKQRAGAVKGSPRQIILNNTIAVLREKISS